MQVEMLAIDSLVEYAANAKQHPASQIAQIKKSIEQFGNNDPIAVDEDNVIIEGHGRLYALQELGFKQVPVIRLTHLSDAQKKAYILAHNKLTMNSGFDLDLLGSELDKIADISDIDMSDFGFELDFGDEVSEDDFNSELPEEPKTKQGDVYRLGRHRLICGDSTNLAVIKRLCGEHLVDLYLTDPPYNVAYEGKTKDKLTIENDKMRDEAFREFLSSAFKAADGVLKSGAAFYIWHADSEGYNFRGGLRDVGWQLKQTLIWVKNAHVMGRQDYHWKHEPCLYGWTKGAHMWTGDRRQTTVLEFDRPNRNAEHPTMKPVALFDYLIRNNTKAGDLVLDSFGGSGTTLIACEQNQRTALISELDPRYCDVIVRRWEDLTGGKAELIQQED